MNFPDSQRYRAAASFGLLFSLILLTSACVSFGSKPPARLLTIVAAEPILIGDPLSGMTQDALFLDQPAVPHSIDTLRVAVRSGETRFTYLKDVLWVDTPGNQFRDVLANMILTRAGKLVLDPEQYLTRRGQTLEGSLLEFGIDAAKQQAVVTYDVSLMAPDGKSVMQKRFSASVPVKAITPDSVAPAISAAANQVAGAVADWIKPQ